ncbi:MAG: WbqC family protein [Proteobacteria bacterium]|nr:WbqC family protein [Pseudomonadota bacterium]
MTIVAIHQPNYLPWLGFFQKIAVADIFVFLDDVQFSKNSYINRVQVLHDGQARWLTQPVSYNFGDTINAVSLAQPDWADRHINSLKGFYRNTPFFREVLPWIEALFGDAPHDDLATINMMLIRAIAAQLELKCSFKQSSTLDTAGASGDDRLIRIMTELAPGGRYLSGAGGANYQEAEKFEAAGHQLVYRSFEHPTYTQQSDSFTAGLSIIDALFSVGWRETAKLLNVKQT